MLRGLIKTMRPHQWIKNGFIFAALFFDQQLSNFPALWKTGLAFIVFCFLASSVYILNDLVDIESDRQHPTKRLRPLPAGKLPIPFARVMVIVLVVPSLILAYFLSPWFLGVCVLYFTINLAYTFWLKHIPLLDILLLASFYVLRVGAGVTLIDVERFSPWLYLFTTFLALFLGVGKRRAELYKMAEDASTSRRVLDGYTLPFLDQVNIIVSSMAITTYSLYTFFAPNLPENHLTMLTIPFVLYGVFRYLYLVQVQNIGEAPEDVLFTDRPLQVTIAGYALVILVVFYVF